MEPVDLGCFSVPTLETKPKSIFTPSGVRAFFRTDSGKKWLMYGSVSAIAIITSWITYFVFHNLLDRGLVESQIWSVIVSTIPAFYLSRKWVWAKDGKVSMANEVIPFWVLSIIQFFISVAALAAAKHWIESSFDSRLVRTIVVQTLNLFLYGVMWVGKFFFLNNLLFRKTATNPSVEAS